MTDKEFVIAMREKRRVYVTANSHMTSTIKILRDILDERQIILTHDPSLENEPEYEVIARIMFLGRAAIIDGSPQEFYSANLARVPSLTLIGLDPEIKEPHIGMASAYWNPRDNSDEELRNAVYHFLEMMYFDYEANLTTSILVDSAKYWDSFFDELRAEPEKWRLLDSRKFEEAIAEILERDGYKTELTKQSRDGGRDILAYLPHSLGNSLFLVECKRYAEENKVGIEIVQRIFGVFSGEKATASAIVTTSDFSSDAKKWRTDNSLEHLVELRNFDYLKEWNGRIRGQ